MTGRRLGLSAGALVMAGLVLATTSCAMFTPRGVGERALALQEVHAVSSVDFRRARSGVTQFAVYSAAGGDREATCSPGPGARGLGVEVVDCGGLAEGEAARIVAALERFAPAFGRHVGGVGVGALRLEVVAEGRYHTVQTQGAAPVGAVPLTLVLQRDSDVDLAVERLAVRLFAHELTHAADDAVHRIGSSRSEYRATIAETCVEFEVFGSTRGYESRQDFMVPIGEYARSLPWPALRSMQIRAKASGDLQALFARRERKGAPVTEDNGGEALRAFCRDALAPRGRG